ncbi:EF-P beta-lysylation protein EpmB [Aestuariicella hydrocarbonica]|uniref:L-lysine 2,3-aminomutase n=1 Tax=Pseudomaricurvus hydrocarbonicus TaxID=1470433 RepID=A0A9E5JUD3_9GAMM|nr:EF-P beta-lysylation protein EpmB [Aestuariicella hydrocarbonica]NHO66993.1 EF-P beta-lysylation protein EpmB [Aestuariicella hydrocarbonica]
MSQRPPVQTLSLKPQISWQEELIQAVRDPQTLLEYLQLPPELLPRAQAACQLFELRAPRPFLDRIAKGDLNDPLLRQVLPIQDELTLTPGYSADPLQEADSNPTQGLVHKYHGRVLLVVAPHCAINCRYCFRREFPYQDNNPSRQQWHQVFDTIRADRSISEVIFSGGDPLASPDRQLQWMVDQLVDIPHIRRLRVHTRLPIVIPQRITDDTLRWLADTRLQSVLVLHTNHPNELDHQVGQSIARLRSAGVTVLNQAVLLQGVNNDLETQIALSEALFAAGALPYYLHLLDKVQGAAHFAVADSDAIALHQQMQSRLPGFLVPKLAREEPGALNKTLIF